MIGLALLIVVNVVWYIFFNKKRKQQKADYKNALLKMTETEDVNAVGPAAGRGVSLRLRIATGGSRRPDAPAATPANGKRACP